MFQLIFSILLFLTIFLLISADNIVEEAASELKHGINMSVNDSACQTKAILIGGGLLAGGLFLGYFWGVKAAQKKAHVNQKVKKDTDKVVDTVDMEDIGEKKVFCRCWRSAQFPYCDGTHNKHNIATGDNVGPLIVKGVAK